MGNHRGTGLRARRVRYGRAGAAVAALSLALAAGPLEAQDCPMPAGVPPLPRVEVHIFQPSCDAPLLSGKRAVGRVWAIWIDDPEAGETDPEFAARITVRDGAGNQIVQGTRIFHRHPWDGLSRSLTEHTWEFSFTPVRGRTVSPLSVEIEPLKDGSQDLFPDPGVRPFEFEAGNSARTDGQRILKVNYVIPLVGEWAGGAYGAASDWVSKNAGVAEQFLVQNLPVHAVQRGGVHPLEVDVPSSTREAPCLTNANATCVLYETWGFDQQVELYLARQFADLADESIVVILLPPGYAGDLFQGRTVFFDLSYRTSAGIVSADVLMPNFPVIVLPVTSGAWTLAHEMGHVFRGPGHVDLGRAQVVEAGGQARETPRSEGIHAFRIFPKSNALGVNKHSEEGNGEDRVLEPLMKDGPSSDGLRQRFVSDAVYRDLLEAVRESGTEIWASVSSGGRDAPGVVPLRGMNGLESWATSPSAWGAGPTPGVGADPGGTQVADASPHFVVGGAVGPGGEVALDPLRIAWLRPEEPGSGDSAARYRLEVRNASGDVVSSRGFDPSPSLVHEGDSSREEEGSSFFVAVPYVAEAGRIVVVDGTGERASLEAGVAPGQVEIRRLEVDDEDGTLRVEWDGGGVDASADLLYSPDGNGSWVAIARSLAPSAVISAHGLRRGSQPTVRLVVHDGLGYVSDLRNLELRHFDIWSHGPAAGDSTVTGEIHVLVNTDLDPADLPEDALVLEDESGQRVVADGGYDPDASRLWLAPVDPLPPGRTWRARVSERLTDRWGNRLRREFEWSFRTEADTRPPRIASTTPRNGDITIAVTVQPAVIFDEPLAEGTEAALRLETIEGRPVAGSVRHEAGEHRLVFEPAQELERNTMYRLVVSSELRDQAGNTLGTVAPITFTTGGHISAGGTR